MSMVQKDGWSFFLAKGGPQVGIVLVHPIYGLDDYVKSVSTKLGAVGFSVAAVDLFKGKRAASLQDGMKLREAVTREDLLSAFESGVSLLRDSAGADVNVGSMGFCMGGGFALQGACSLGLKFCVDYYGMIPEVEDLKGINGPVLLILGGDDERITPWAFQSFLPSATRRGWTFTSTRTPGTPSTPPGGRATTRRPPKTPGRRLCSSCHSSIDRWHRSAVGGELPVAFPIPYSKATGRSDRAH